MSTRLITLLLGALIALPSYAQNLRSTALQIIKSQPIEQSGSQGLITVFQNKKTLQLREKLEKRGAAATTLPSGLAQMTHKSTSLPLPIAPFPR